MIFVFRIGQSGDTLVSLPAVLALKEMYPGEQFTLIANKPQHSASVTAWNVLRHTGCFGSVLFDQPGNLFSLASLLLKIDLWEKEGNCITCPPLAPAGRSQETEYFFESSAGSRKSTAFRNRG